MDTMKKTQTGVFFIVSKSLRTPKHPTAKLFPTQKLPQNTHTLTPRKQTKITDTQNKQKHTPQKNTPMKKKKRSLMREEEDPPSFANERRRRSKVPPWFQQRQHHRH
jgi:hypothetical protein